MRKFLNVKNNVIILIFISFVIIYLMTMSRTVSFIDSGELATACYTLGIAHPTGYPLFTIVGFFFSHLPFFEPIINLNIMCVLFCVMGLLFLFITMNFILTNIPFGSKITSSKKRSKKNETFQVRSFESPLIILSSLFSVLSLGLSENYWMQSTSIEVYSLHCMMIGILLFLFIKNIYNKNISLNNWSIFAFILGLSFTNHMTSLYLMPGFIYLFFAKYKFEKETYILILKIIPFFVIGLLVYLYFPVRASQSPLLNWGNPTTYERFIRHISGKQFQVWMFSSFGDAMNQLKYFISTVPKDFFYIPILFSFAGIIFLFKFNRKLFYFFLILFLTTMLMAINYSIHDIDSYFLLAYFVLSILAGFGCLYVFNWLKNSNKGLNIKVYSIVLLIPVIELINFPNVNESKNYLVEDYTYNVFKSVEKNGIVISFQWDNWVSSSYYFQNIKNIRKDITVIDKELLRRSWYFDQLQNMYPWLIEKSKIEIEEFKKELYKFENDLNYDPNIIQTKYINMINSFIDKNISERSVYVTNEIEQEIGAKYQRVPEGLVYKLYSERSYHPYPLFESQFRSYPNKNKYIENLLEFYSLMFTNRAIYENNFGKSDTSFYYIKKALEIIPKYQPAIRFKNNVLKK